MTKYIETIKVVDGQIQNLEYHRARMHRTVGCDFDIAREVPEEFRLGVVKYRIVYNANEVIEVAYSHYVTPVIETLKVVECEGVEYSLKYDDRTVINDLMARRGDCDDIIIVRDGFVTDTSFCNIVLCNSSGFFTPDTPLLEGTKRAQLIAQNRLNVVPIKVGDIQNFDKIILVNAMMELELNVSAVSHFDLFSK